MKHLFFWLILVHAPLTLWAVEPDTQFGLQLLNSEVEQFPCLKNEQGKSVLEIAPVNLPHKPLGDNNHYGWPVATQSGKTMIVVHRAMPGHNAKLSGAADQDTSYSVLVRSEDHGKTWSEQYDIRDCILPEDRDRGGFIPLSHRYKYDSKNKSPLGYKIHLNAIGTTRFGAVILVGNHGVFRSNDAGESWKHLPLAFREDHHSGPFVYVGPRIIDHPQMGLLLFGHHTKYRGVHPDEIVRELAIYQSQDDGNSWKNISLALPEWCHQAEPNVIMHDDEFLIIARNQTTRRLIQMRWKPGSPIQAQDTNMLSKRSVDTSDIMFNPVTNRFEVVQSNRTSMTINLFSLSAQDWETAEWKFERGLLKRGGDFYKNADGFHTGGALVDLQNQQQHVFFYAGAPGGPAGVFRLTRTLNTPQLVEAQGP